MKTKTHIKRANTPSVQETSFAGDRPPDMVDLKPLISRRVGPIAAAVLLALGIQSSHAASVTYIVGTCQAGTQFKTIQLALNATPAPTTVEVCPGNYYEQLAIKHPVTLQGITAADGSLAEILLPSNYTENAVLKNEGANDPAIVQIYVNNVTGGSVNLSNLEVNGMGAGVPKNSVFVGIAYQQSSGTISHVITSSQDGNAGSENVVGWGVWIDGGSTNPTVTVENSNFNSSSFGGIFATGETESGSDVTVNISNNYVSLTDGYVSGGQGAYGVVVEEGTNATVSGNVIKGGSYYGVMVDASKGSITGNTIINSESGIGLASDGPSVTSNGIYDVQADGIDVFASLKSGKIQNNVISSAGSRGSVAYGIGIELDCNSESTSQISSNTIINTMYGYDDALKGFSPSGTYAGVATDVTTCSTSSVSSQKLAAARAKLRGQQ